MRDVLTTPSMDSSPFAPEGHAAPRRRSPRRARLAARLTVEQHRTGSVIIKGSSGAAAYFLIGGTCEVRREGRRGSKRVGVMKRGRRRELSIINPAHARRP
jgi:hypothetical protein